MASSPPQRVYRAPCPGCGAPVEFRSAQSTHAVCPYCQSTVVRSGEVLQRVGRMAEVFDDHSPLQLGASGRLPADWPGGPGGPGGQAFTLIGRLQYQGEQGRWAEWIALLQDGTSATLGEDNGAYVVSLPATARELPPPERLPLGLTTSVAGKPFSVAAHLQAQLVAAEGELPTLAPLGQPFTVVELRSADGEVLSIDYGSAPPQVQRGRSVLLQDLALQGLKDESVREEAARQLDCPNCGAPVAVQLDTSKSCTCPSCHSIIDLSSGLGGELRHAAQRNPISPLIPLGSVGRFEGADWQVVGFQHRTGVEVGDDEEESFGWEEYLLYNRQRGFIFLVDASDGWSLVRPATGAPTHRDGTALAQYLGRTYRLTSRYRAETGYVAGEFYWPVHSGQVTSNADFAAVDGKGILSREQAPGEVTWSHGQRLDSAAVASAFKLDARAGLFRRQDAGPIGGIGGSSLGCGTLILIFIVLLILLVLMSNCSGSSGSSSYRSSGGSWGGYTSGGGHK